MFLRNILIGMMSCSDFMWNLFRRMILNAKLSGIHLYKTCKIKKILINLRNFLQTFLLVDFFPKYQKIFVFHRGLLLSNTNNFPLWVKILGKRKHVIFFKYLKELFVEWSIDILCKNKYNNCVKLLITWFK